MEGSKEKRKEGRKVGRKEGREGHQSLVLWVKQFDRVESDESYKADLKIKEHGIPNVNMLLWYTGICVRMIFLKHI